jgi:hypothetical protein
VIGGDNLKTAWNLSCAGKRVEMWEKQDGRRKFLLS